MFPYVFSSDYFCHGCIQLLLLTSPKHYKFLIQVIRFTPGSKFELRTHNGNRPVCLCGSVQNYWAYSGILILHYSVNPTPAEPTWHIYWWQLLGHQNHHSSRMILINPGFMKMEYLSGTDRSYVYRSTSSNVALFYAEHHLCPNPCIWASSALIICLHYTPQFLSLSRPIPLISGILHSREYNVFARLLKNPQFHLP